MRVRNSLSMLGLLCVAGLAYAATKGDQNPFGRYGVVQVTAWDAGTTAPSCLAISNQNSIMIRNSTNDGGAGSTAYCGFDTSVTILTGMPILVGETLTVDMVAVTTNATSVATPGIADGGVTVTAGSAGPQLCCIRAQGTAPADIHWMIVK